MLLFVTHIRFCALASAQHCGFSLPGYFITCIMIYIFIGRTCIKSLRALRLPPACRARAAAAIAQCNGPPSTEDSKQLKPKCAAYRQPRDTQSQVCRLPSAGGRSSPSVPPTVSWGTLSVSYKHLLGLNPSRCSLDDAQLRYVHMPSSSVPYLRMSIDIILGFFNLIPPGSSHSGSLPRPGSETPSKRDL